MQTKRVLFNIFLFSLLLVVFTWVGKEVVVKHRGTRTDFYAIWYGSNLTINRSSPYSWESTQTIHSNLSGSPLNPGVYAHSFAYPAYLAIVLFPFAILPYPAAFLIWTGAQLPMLFTALYLLIKFLEIKLNKLELAFLFIAGTIGFLYPLVSYALGQISIFLLFLLTAILYFSKQMKLVAAGILLALTAIRPDIFVVTSLAAFVIVWGSKQALKRLALTTVISLLMMNILSFFFLGNWYPDWVNMLLTYATNNPKTHWPLEIIPNTALSLGIMLILLAYLLWQLTKFFQKPTINKQLLIISTVFLVHSVVFKITGSYQMTLLLIPALILLRFYTQRNSQWIVWIMLFIPWLFYGLTGRTDSGYTLLLIPSAFLIMQAPLLKSAA